jgi:hypothetical protein
MSMSLHGKAIGGAMALALAEVVGLPAMQAQAAGQSTPVLRDFIGINGHSVAMTSHAQLYTPVTTLVRDYHPMGWDVATTSANTRFPYGAPGTESWLNWRTEYGTWADKGLRTNLDIQFENFGQNAWANRAVDAYKYGKAVGTYFGTATSPGGKSLTTSFEIGNEPGILTYTDANFITVFRNMAQGIRDSGTTLPIVTCNVTVGASTEYSRNVDLLKTNNMLGLVDVLATHTYPFLQGWPTWKKSYPEDPRMTYLSDVQNLVTWRNQNAPGKQVWVTEFGYDSPSPAAIAASTDKDITFVTDRQQAQYLTRSYLAFSRMGVDRAYAYYYNDDDTASLHAAAGLTRNFVPKPSYYALAHLQQTLGDYRFSQAVQEDQGSLYIYSYVSESDPNDLIWTLWSPTGSDREALVTLSNLPGNPVWAEQMPLAAGTAPVVSYQTLAPGQLQLMVGESPIYLHMQVAVPEPATGMLLLCGSVLLLRHRR